MDNTSNTANTGTANTSKLKPKQTTTTTTTSTNKRKNRNQEEEAEKDEIVEGDGEVWDSFDTNFKQVQSVLDRNRVLIQQVNENHQSRTADNMVKNVALIKEINGNINKVVSLYSDFSTDFSTMFHQRNQDDDVGEDRDCRGT